MSYSLQCDTDPAWVDCVLDNFGDFLVDHAASERKAHAAAMHFAVRYHDKPELIDHMIGLAADEIDHFHEVFRLLRERGRTLEPDEKDPYANALLKHARSSGLPRLMDRLLIGSISEYRGCERFALLSRALSERPSHPEADLADFYEQLAADDSRHRQIYLKMAREYFDNDDIESRLDELLDHEANVVRNLEARPALH